MKKILAIVLILGGVVLTSVFIGGFLSKNESESSSSTPSSDQSSGTADATNKSSNATFSLAEVQQHATKSDCWIIVDNNVYNVTEYINSHPGGASEITRNCGKDATSDFKTQGGEGSHSSSATATLKTLLIGSLK